MRSIAIVGAGQAGLQLALGLQQHGYRVTLVSDRKPSEIWNGSVMSTQCMFHDALECERALDLQMWENECPPIEGIGLNIAGPDGQIALGWKARLDKGIDQLVRHANDGFNAMPAMGQCNDCSADDLRALTLFMARSGS